MKFCFSTLGCVDNTLEESILLAKRFSLEGLELRGVDGEIDNGKISCFKEENATKTKNIFSENKIVPIVLGTSCAFHTEEKCESSIIEGKNAIDIASRLGTAYIRVFGNNITGDREKCFATVVKGISELCDYAKNKKVGVLLEVHGDFNTVENLMPIVRSLEKYENFGLIWDIAHTHKIYGDSWQTFYGEMKKYIRHMHIKDISDSQGCLVLPGKGDIPILPIIKQLSNDGYSGYFSLEWEKKWHPELPDITKALECFSKLIKELG
ncbi:MAG: sugar phosphate isomerase/epimerase [Clostridia bacterium]|nr:sugar phosphate isomerase/epimerase [Clostridia bacterium]